ncbi:MAG: hypothetical protein ACI9FW_001864, partial [Flavobacterium sp.]
FVLITYSISDTLRKIKVFLIRMHEDFFLNEFYAKYERSYLKFLIKVPAFTITATEYLEKSLNDE